jgi:hypothetical protein
MNNTVLVEVNGEKRERTIDYVDTLTGLVHPVTYGNEMVCHTVDGKVLIVQGPVQRSSVDLDEPFPHGNGGW